MPELPEVQTTVNGIQAYAKGLTIKDIWTDYSSLFPPYKDSVKNPTYFLYFKKTVKNAKIIGSSRRGKNVLIHLSNNQTIIIHMKMTGHIMYGAYKKEKSSQGESWRPADEKNKALHDPFNRFLHLVFSFTNGKHLVLSDMRKFAKITLAETDKLALSPHISKHGPEPLEKDFKLADFKKALLARLRGKIKQVLMDHTIISGVGNIYSDEILWRSGVHPLRTVEKVSEKEWSLLYKSMREILCKGIDLGGDSMSDYRNIMGERGKFQEKHTAYQKTGLLCSKRGCTGIIKRIKVGARSAHFCDKHQK